MLNQCINNLTFVSKYNIIDVVDNDFVQQTVAASRHPPFCVDMTPSVCDFKGTSVQFKALRVLCSLHMMRFQAHFRSYQLDVHLMRAVVSSGKGSR